MEMKKFEEFYSLCEGTASRQRLLGAEDSDIAYLLLGMIAAHPEEEYSSEQIGKLRDLSIKKESQKETERMRTRLETRVFDRLGNCSDRRCIHVRAAEKNLCPGG